VVAADDAAEPKEIPMSKTKRQSPLQPSGSKATKQDHLAQQITVKAAPRKADTLAVAKRQPHKPPSAQTKRRDSKQARIITMLQAPGGATIDAMMRATGWQQDSVRGFLAGVVRKKLGFNLVSTMSEGKRIYRIADKISKSSANEKVPRAA
jgi:hypothetical protein